MSVCLSFLQVYRKYWTLLSSTRTIEQGLKLNLTCRFSGVPPPNVTWLFQDAPLMWQTSIKTDHSISVLTLSDTTSALQGNYTCRIWNKFGSDNATVATLPNAINPTGKHFNMTHAYPSTKFVNFWDAALLAKIPNLHILWPIAINFNF